MKENLKEQLTIFISYHHRDHRYAEVFTKEFKKHSNLSKTIKWKTWTDADGASQSTHPPEKKWHEAARKEMEACDFAFILVSRDFQNSKGMDKSEFNALLKQARENRFLFFPVLLTPCDTKDWPELQTRRFFMPKGIDYGKPWLEQLAYGELVEFNESGEDALPNPNRKRYLAAMIKALQQAVSEHRPQGKTKQRRRFAPQQDSQPSLFKCTKTSGELIPQDILGPGRRSSVTSGFYWRRKPDDILDNFLKKGRSVLVLGNSLSGKSRALYESLKKLNNTTLLITGETYNPDMEIKLPETGSAIAVFDDIDQWMCRHSVENLQHLLNRLVEAGVAIAATARRGHEFRIFENMVLPAVAWKPEKVYINRLAENQVKAFTGFYKKHRKKTECPPLDEQAFDGNIGSYFMDLTAVNERYKDLEKIIRHYDLQVPAKLPREILKALKYFYYTENIKGPGLYQVRRVKDFCERSLLGKRGKNKEKDFKPKRKDENPWQQSLEQFSTPKSRWEYSAAEWDQALTFLSEPDYELKMLHLEDTNIYIDEIYLERIVNRGLRPDRLLFSLRDNYRGENLQRHGFLTSPTGFTKLVNLARSAEEAYNALKRFNSPATKLGTLQFNVLMNRSANPKEARSFLEKMQAEGLKPDVFSFNALINKSRSFKEALSFLEKLKSLGIAPNGVTMISLIGKTASFADVTGLLDGLKGLEVKAAVDENAFQSLYKKVESAADAVTLMDRLTGFGINPEAITLHTYLDKAASFAEALALLERSGKAGLKPAANQLDALVEKTTTHEESLTLLSLMKEHGLTPDPAAFNSLLHKAETFAGAAALLDKAIETNIQPNLIIYNTLINKAETFEKAISLLEQMKENSLRPDVVTFTTLVNKAGSFKEALSSMDKMKEMKITPNVITYTSLIGKGETFKDVVDTLKQMREQGIQPNKITVNQLLKKVQESPRPLLEYLLETVSPEELFSDFLLNRLIGEAIKCDKTCVECITPHASIIAKQKAKTILHYARLLEYHGAAETALIVLEGIEQKDFDYYNIRANCLKDTDFDGALDSYKQALELAADPVQKSIVLNNAAQLIFDHEYIELYEQAIEYCNEALSCRSYSQFPYPGDLLLLLTLLKTPPEKLQVTLDAIISKHGMKPATLATLVEKMNESQKALIDSLN